MKDNNGDVNDASGLPNEIGHPDIHSVRSGEHLNIWVKVSGLHLPVLEFIEAKVKIYTAFRL